MGLGGKLAHRQLGGTNLQLPTLGIGGAAFGGLFATAPRKESMSTLDRAKEVGLTYIDTAPYYGFGRSERVIGDAVRKYDYIISTKVGRLLKPGMADNPAQFGWPDPLPFHPVYDYSYDGIMRSYEASLHRTGLDRLDILLVHDIGTATHGPEENLRHMKDLQGGIRALQELKSSGAISAMGLGVNETAICMELMKQAHWDAFLLAGRYTLLEQAPLKDLLPACIEAQTSIILGGPFNSGILVGGNTWNYGSAPPEILAHVTALKECCQEFSVDLAAAALHFPLAHPAIASVIPGMRNRSELEDILKWIAADIPVAFWSRLKERELLPAEAPVPSGNLFFEQEVKHA
ncbi:aldo/keto reductase [Pseudovibrio ascidiaceicola]|uniref:aldo/keto reductase n=1 Tax=Pseudovibrio ascidiaceicola TaxID=285279 RepID=UPI003D35FCAA